ncbi:MAG TPA: DUF6058 family natural product biosynthesis protein [Povalibacter sp.]|nr:DUF6058 family natural product biosynthesis protein [Povalibacter sp.]
MTHPGTCHLDSYLGANYLTAEEFAAACGISAHEITRMVDVQLIPQPSYVVTTDGILVSQAFGKMAADGAMPGRYFHPAAAVWVSIARQLEHAVGTALARHALELRFRANFATALAELDRDTYRLPDSFTDSGQPIVSGVEARTAEAWISFMQGIFGLCVADPSSERAIARKEILQEALTRLTENGSRTDFSPETAAKIGELVDQYDRCVMPFAPPEYARSSRKRLVDDLRHVLARSTPGVAR